MPLIISAGDTITVTVYIKKWTFSEIFLVFLNFSQLPMFTHYFLSKPYNPKTMLLESTMKTSVEKVTTLKHLVKYTLCEKCPNTEFFWSVFSCIWTEYGEILRSLRIQSECGKIRIRKIPCLDTFHAVILKNVHDRVNFDTYKCMASIIF